MSGAARSTSDIGHHTIVFGDAWEQTFRDIIDDGRLMGDPSLLVTRPTAGDPRLAPAGRDLLYILAPAPNTEVGKVDWDAIGAGLHRADARSGHRATAPTRRRRRSAARGRSGRLGPSGHGGGHPVRAGPHVRPDRPVPAGQHRPRHRQRGAGRFVDGARVSACRPRSCPGGWPPTGSPESSTRRRPITRWCRR